MVYSYNDFEHLFIRYKVEAVPAGISIESFCQSNKVPIICLDDGTRILAARLFRFKSSVFPPQTKYG